MYVRLILVRQFYNCLTWLSCWLFLNPVASHCCLYFLDLQDLIKRPYLIRTNEKPPLHFLNFPLVSITSLKELPSELVWVLQRERTKREIDKAGGGRKIYYKELVHIVMEVEKSQEQWLVS